MRSMLFVLLVGALASHAAAQSKFPADEKALRDLAAKLDTGTPAEETPNGIVFTGALRQPRVRGEAPAQPIARVQGRQDSATAERAPPGPASRATVTSTAHGETGRPDRAPPDPTKIATPAKNAHEFEIRH
jgi:hypothetical protein